MTGEYDITTVYVGMLPTNCYLLANNKTKQAVIIDPGGDEDRISHVIEKRKMIPEAILLTHAHFDHILAVSGLVKKYNIKVYMHEAEKELASDPLLNMSGGYAGNAGVTVNADVLLKDNEIISLAGANIKVIHTPGHTAGSCCYYIPSEKVLFAGDTVFEGSYGRVDLPTSSVDDMIKSLEKVLAGDLPDDTRVLSGHGFETTVKNEKRTLIWLH